MPRVLLTGISGTGKSTLLGALAARGFRAVDADGNGLSELVETPGDDTGVAPGRDWLWHEERMALLLAGDPAEVLFVGGCAPNQGRFRARFAHVVLLTAPPDVLAARLATRTTNDYGKGPGEADRVLAQRHTVEPLLRASADLVLDTSAPLDEVVGALVALVCPAQPPGPA